MDSKILSLIDIAVESGEVTAKQRDIIYKKAAELGVDEAEVDIVIDSKLNEILNPPASEPDKNLSNENMTISVSSKERRKLYKRKEDGKLSGVCAGLGEYFHISPAIFRCVFILTYFISIWAYIVLAIVMPKEEEVSI